MSAMQETVTNAQVAVKYWQNVSSLSIDMSAVRQSDNHSRSTYRPTYRSTYQPMLDRHFGPYVDRHISVYISTDTTNMSADISVECRSICRPIYRSRGAQNTHDPISLEDMPNIFALGHYVPQSSQFSLNYALGMLFASLNRQCPLTN